MHIEHEPVESLKKMIRSVLSEHLDLRAYRVFFFGSRLSGSTDDRADIDIGIEGPEPVKSHVLQKIREQLEELAILYTIDIVDFRRVPQAFRDLATRNTEEIA